MDSLSNSVAEQNSEARSYQGVSESSPHGRYHNRTGLLEQRPGILGYRLDNVTIAPVGFEPA